MRNLKRALSLTLASIMLLGMMVVGSSAASYQDVTDEHNVEAIEVLQAVGIMVGDEGNFNPEKNVTRNEMAVIMSNLMDYRVATYAGTSPFTDVPSWAEPYVAACYTNGITSGTSATTYNGSGNVTTAQAALMVMKALGYFQNSVDFGTDWQLETTRQANKIDLLVGVKASVKEAMTRNDVARLVLNGLEAGTVEADNSNSINVSVGGEMVSIGGTKYEFVISNEDYAKAINPDASTTNVTDSGASIVELGEKLYQGSLTKLAWEKNNRDSFERPADHWEYQGKDIGTYTKDANTTFTKKVTTKALYNAVGSAACDYNWYVSVDGVIQGDRTFGSLVNTNKTDDNDCFLNECLGIEDDLQLTGNGVQTQVYVDGNRGRVYVSVVHYFPAEVLRVNNASDADRSITLSNLDNSNGATTKDVFETEDFADGDIVVYSYSKKSEAIEEVCLAERLEGKITQARALENASKKDGDHFTVDETKYNYNQTVSAAAPRRLTTENVNNNMVGYLDQYGYVIYIDDAAATYDYAYVLTMGSRTDEFGGLNGNTRANSNGETWYARLVLTDGTVVKAETDQDDNSLWKHIVSYSVDSKGVYALRDQSNAAIGDGSLKITNGAAGIKVNGDPAFTANADTVFIIADSDEKSADDFNYRVYTGIKNVPDIENWNSGSKVTYSVAAKGANGIAKVVYIQDADVSGTKNVIFIKANENAKFDKTTDSTRNYVISAVEDGEVVTLLVRENSEAAKKLVTAIEKNKGYAQINGTSGIVAAEYLTRDTDGIVTNVKLYNEPLDGEGDGYLIADGTLRAERQTVGLGTERKGYSDSTIVVRYDVKSGDFFPETNLNGIKNDADDKVIGILDTGTLTGICYLNTTSGAGEEPSGGSNPDGTYNVNVTIDGVKDETLSKTGLKDGAAYTVEYTVPAGKTATYGDKTYTAGEKITVTGKIDKGSVTIAITTKAVVTKTLTLTGALAGDTNILVFAGSTDITAQGVVKNDPDNGRTLVFTVSEGAKVTIRSATVNVTDGTYTMADGTKVEVTAGKAVINSLDANAVLAGLNNTDTATPTRTYTITVEDGMELSAFTNASGDVSNADAVASKDGNVYTMKASANITGFSVKIDSTKNDSTYAFVSDDSNPVNNYNIHNGSADTTQKALTTAAGDCTNTAVAVTTPNPNHNVHVLGGHEVKFTHINPACFGMFPSDKNASGTITSIVQRGFAIPVSIDINDDDASAAIWLSAADVTAGKTAAQDRVHNGFKIEADGSLVGAVKVELVDVTATINGASKGGTWYVKTGTSLSTPAVVSGKGTAVIDASKGETFGAAISSNVTATGKDFVLKAATVVTGAADIRVEAFNTVTEMDGTVLNGAGTIAVVPGTTIKLYGSANQTLAVKTTSGSNAVTEGVNISGNTGTFKVGTVAVTLSQA